MSLTLSRQERRALQRQQKKALSKALSRNRALSAAEDLAQKKEELTLRQHLRSGSLGPREVERGVELLNRVDGMSGVRNALRKLAEMRKDWAGIPLPLSEHPLVVEPTYPYADKIMAEFGPTKEEGTPIKVRNSWWSMAKRGRVVVFEYENGKIDWGIDRPGNPVDRLIKTIGTQDAWGIEQERAAVDTLGSMLRHRQFKQYLLTGMFMERSARSGVHYIFRRLRPTIAFTERVKPGQGLRVLCTLCLHPIGYYDDTWSGAMCPTDDVVAHLALMRGDEHLFWRRANQHPSWEPNGGLMV